MHDADAALPGSFEADRRLERLFTRLVWLCAAGFVALGGWSLRLGFVRDDAFGLLMAPISLAVGAVFILPGLWLLKKRGAWRDAAERLAAGPLVPELRRVQGVMIGLWGAVLVFDDGEKTPRAMRLFSTLPDRLAFGRRLPAETAVKHDASTGLMTAQVGAAAVWGFREGTGLLKTLFAAPKRR